MSNDPVYRKIMQENNMQDDITQKTWDEKTLAEAYRMIDPHFHKGLDQRNLALKMYPIIRGGSSPCVEFKKWREVIFFLEQNKNEEAMFDNTTANKYQIKELEVVQAINLPCFGDKNKVMDLAIETKKGDKILKINGHYYALEKFSTKTVTTESDITWRRLSLSKDFIEANTPTFFK